MAARGSKKRLALRERGQRATEVLGYRLVPWVVLLITLFATVLAWWLTSREFARRDKLRFDSAVEDANVTIRRRMNDEVELLRSTAAFIETTNNLSRTTFRRYADRQNLATNYSGILGLGFSFRVPAGALEDLAQKMREEGHPNFTVRPGDAREEVHSIIYLEPEVDPNTKAVGYDMFSEPVRREAMERARDTANAAVTGKVMLVQDEPNVVPAFLVYFPVYAVDQPQDLEGRRAHLIGFAYSPIRAGEWFDATFSEVSNPALALEIYDSPKPSEANLLYRTPNFREVASSNPRIITSESQEILGRHWTINYFSSEAFEFRSGAKVANVILPTGGLIALLLFALSFLQHRSQLQAQVHASELARRATGERLLANAGKILSESMDYERTLENVARSAVPEFADWCAVDLVIEGTNTQRLAVAHVDPEKIRWAREIQEKYPPDPESTTGTPKVIRTGEPELYPYIPEELILATARDEEHLRIIREIQFSSAMLVPMIARGRVLGVLTFVWAESGNHYDRDDLRLAEDLAGRAATAIDNAMLFRAAQQEVDERAKAEDEVRHLNENLERLVEERTRELKAANQELEAFCYSVSHDLRSPLRSVDGFSKAVLEDYGDKLGDEAIDYLHRVRTASKRMDELITALLDLSRLTRAELVRESLDIRAIARHSFNDAKRAAVRDDVEFEVQPGLEASGDAKMVAVVLDNLIGNAMKFSSTSQQPRVEVGQTPDGAFYVKDNGVGFNPEYAGKLFKPFERLHSTAEFPGSGIGLATVQRIIHRHGGRVWAESSSGEGATFYFTLP